MVVFFQQIFIAEFLKPNIKQSYNFLYGCPLFLGFKLTYLYPKTLDQTRHYQCPTPRAQSFFVIAGTVQRVIERRSKIILSIISKSILKIHKHSANRSQYKIGPGSTALLIGIPKHSFILSLLNMYQCYSYIYIYRQCSKVYVLLNAHCHEFT